MATLTAMNIEPIQPSRIDAAFVDLMIEEWPACRRAAGAPAPAAEESASAVGVAELRRLADAPPAFEGHFDGHKTMSGTGVVELAPADLPMRLRVTPRGLAEQMISLNTEPVTIGRRSGNTVSVLCDRLSRNHAKIWRDETGIHLEDFGSSNGTFVNDVRVTACDLTVGDVVKLGSVTIHVEEDAIPI